LQGSSDGGNGGHNKQQELLPAVSSSMALYAARLAAYIKVIETALGCWDRHDVECWEL